MGDSNFDRALFHNQLRKAETIPNLVSLSKDEIGQLQMRNSYRLLRLDAAIEECSQKLLSELSPIEIKHYRNRDYALKMMVINLEKEQENIQQFLNNLPIIEKLNKVSEFHWDVSKKIMETQIPLEYFALIDESRYPVIDCLDKLLKKLTESLREKNLSNKSSRATKEVKQMMILLLGSPLRRMGTIIEFRNSNQFRQLIRWGPLFFWIYDKTLPKKVVEDLIEFYGLTEKEVRELYPDYYLPFFA